MRAQPMLQLRSSGGSHPGFPLLIDGQWRGAQSGSVFAPRDPFKEEDWGAVANAQAADVDAAVTAASRAFAGGRWSGRLAGERARALFRLAD
jgi:acyl-CoA reductase-like NAD-dependent aldehyde dehydrogenase